MKSLLEGKVILITGGASGIGAATAEVCLEQGALVMIADRSPPNPPALSRLTTEPGSRCGFTPCDVTRATDCQSAVAATLQRFGQLDGAFNNAGIVRHGFLLDETPEADWDDVIAVNLKGVFLAMKAEIPALRQRGGAIVNTSSVGGKSGAARLASYCASKHAVIGLTRSAAIEYAEYRIRVNAVCPGATRTPMLENWFSDPGVEAAILAAFPMRRTAGPDEIARCVAFLLSDSASFVTGTAMAVDGGFLA